MGYRKHLNTRQVNQLLEHHYFQKKAINEDVKFTMGANKEIQKLVFGKPEDLTDDEKLEIKNLDKTTDEKVLTAIEKLNQKFGSK